MTSETRFGASRPPGRSEPAEKENFDARSTHRRSLDCRGFESLHSCHSVAAERSDALTLAALEPLAAEHLQTVVRDVPGVAAQLAGEGAVQETPHFAFARKEA